MHDRVDMHVTRSSSLDGTRFVPRRPHAEIREKPATKSQPAHAQPIAKQCGELEARDPSTEPQPRRRQRPIPSYYVFGNLIRRDAVQTLLLAGETALRRARVRAAAAAAAANSGPIDTTGLL